MNNFVVLNIGHAQTIHKWWNEDISSPFVRIFFVKSGKAVVHLADKDVTLSPGHMYMLPCYTPHSYECDPGFEFYYLFVFLNEQKGTDFFDLYDYPIEVKANHAAQLLFENYCMLYPQLNLPSKKAEDFINHMSYRDYQNEYLNMATYERLQLHGMVEIVVSYFVKHARPKSHVHDKRISLALDWMQEHLDQNISMEELASKACLTKSYLIRLFRQKLGITPLQYIIRKKIHHTQTLLLGTEMNIQKIASAVGMEDTSYFIRLFKKNIGITPQEYRKKMIG